MFYRFVWEKEGGYTLSITHEHADEYMKELAYGDSSQDNKANHMKAVKALFRWRSYEFDEEEWEPEITFSNNTSTTNPRDYLTIDERKKLREAALNYKSVPSYLLSPPKNATDGRHTSPNASRYPRTKLALMSSRRLTVGSILL